MKGLPPGAAPPAAELLVPASMVFTPPKGKYHCKMYCSGGGGRRARIGVIEGRKLRYKSNGSSSGASLIL